MRRTQPDDLIVTDSSPLITLALADNLHALIVPRMRLVIPDAVWVEAAREGAPGASAMVEWVARNDTRVTVRPTEVGLDQLQRLRDGRKIRNMGEAAALEILATTAALDPERHQFLIFEDKDAEKKTAILPARAYAISTGDWLRAAERNGLIQSADAVLDKAVDASRDLEAKYQRNMDRQRKAISKPEAISTVTKRMARAVGGRGS